MQESEIRKDYFLEKYVIIAPKRLKKPEKIYQKPETKVESCVFCAPDVDDPQKQIQVKDYYLEGGKWGVKVIGNLFPALSLNNIKAYGEQEIVIETRKHGIEIHELSVDEIVKVFDVYTDRYNTLMEKDGICYTIVFKNEGGKAGASIPHSHSQIISLPIIPPKIAEESAAMDKYIDEHGSCPYCDIIKSEKGGPRVIAEDEHIFVLAPYASESPYGAWFLPKRHIRNINDLHENEKKSLANFLKKILTKLEEIDAPYNYFIQNSLDLESHHFILKLAPRPNIWAGLELGTGIIINPVSPEEATKFYRG
ncbi:MAG: hypothetical protein PHW75_00730 [Patescibacteria group bacterium]|nr:hypothetical protein [Patescibacteria group bacterium]